MIITWKIKYFIVKEAMIIQFFKLNNILLFFYNVN